MKISQAIFSGSSRFVDQKPKQKLPEFAFIGRSNVGKSSLINSLCNQKNLALTSSKPGKTQLVNHFKINDSWYLVDLPGYGYARTSKTQRDNLQKIIMDYLNNSEELINLFVLLDCRLDLQKIDLQFLIELGNAGVPFSIVYTKTDKLGKESLGKQVQKNNAELMNYWEELPPVFLTSAAEGNGREEVLDYIGTLLKK